MPVVRTTFQIDVIKSKHLLPLDFNSWKLRLPWKNERQGNPVHFAPNTMTPHVQVYGRR